MEPAIRSVTPLYSDLSEFTVATYSKEEILAEKMRALLLQQLKWPTQMSSAQEGPGSDAPGL
jgi:hypothetical protein